MVVVWGMDCGWVGVGMSRDDIDQIWGLLTIFAVILVFWWVFK